MGATRAKHQHRLRPPARRSAVGRRGVLTASAGALSLAALAWWVAAPDVGGGGGGGYLAAGPAGPSRGPDHAVAPTGKVTMVPLPQDAAAAPSSTPDGGAATGGMGRGTTGTSAGAPAASADPGAGTGASRPASPVSPTTPPGGPGAPGTPGPPGTPGNRPAHLTVSTPQDAAASEPWCQNVTVAFTNGGDLPATSGTVTFATHIIGLLGIDWGTVDTAEKVPVPIAGGARANKTWEICVDAWRVPLGMHLDTETATLSGT